MKNALQHLILTIKTLVTDVVWFAYRKPVMANGVITDEGCEGCNCGGCSCN